MASSPRSSSLPSLLHSIPLLLLGGLLLVAGCDSSVDLQQDDADPTARTVPADSSGLALAPMPTGSELLTPGAPAPKNNADASAYGCYLASRPYSDEVAFDSRYLHFPEEVVAEAGNDTRRVTHRVQVGTDENNASEGVRYMHCVIPDSDQAADLARDQILNMGLEQAAREVMDDSEASQSKSSCFIQVDYTTICWGNDTGSDCKHEQHVDIICHDGGGSGETGGDGDSGGESSPWPDDPEGSDGDGSPDDGGSPDEDTCTELIPEPGSDCEPVDPCESDNPPAHCDDEEDDVTPCSEVEFEDEVDGELIRALEEKGILEDLWDKSNLDQAQRNREERGGWITLEDGEYELVEFHEAYSGIEYKPFGIRGLRSGQRPAGTVAVVHTHPFEPGEVISDEEAIRAYIEHLNAELEDYDIESLSSNGSIVYNSEPSDNDLAGAAALQMRSYFYDGDNIVAFGASVEYGEDNEDDELILTYEEMYERCGY